MIRLFRFGATVSLFLMVPLIAACSASDLGVSTTSPTTTTVSSNCAAFPKAIEANNASGAYGPDDLRQAYGLNNLIAQGNTGKGQTVVLIESFGSPSIQSDIDAYSELYGLPAITIDQRAPIGENPAPTTSAESQDQQGWAGETTLDVDMVHALAPDAKIVILTSPVSETEGVQGFPEFLKLMQYAVDNKLGNIISMSFGAGESTLCDKQGQQLIGQWNTFLQDATTNKDVTFFASSGDNGSTDFVDLNATQLSTFPMTSFPTANPWVTSVGGTSLRFSGQQAIETAWDGSGGGFSAYWPIPSYQKTLPAVTQSQFSGRRGVPDVAALADPGTGVRIIFNGNSEQIGGTSASAPMWAGMMAIADQMAGKPLGFINPALYKLGTSDKASQYFNDITSGSNQQGSVPGYDAVTGWDAVTGFGTPNCAELLPALIDAVQAGA